MADLTKIEVAFEEFCRGLGRHEAQREFNLMMFIGGAQYFASLLTCPMETFVAETKVLSADCRRNRDARRN